MPSAVKPMRPIDRKLHIASAALADAKHVGVKRDIDQWLARIDELLDEKLGDTAGRLVTAKRIDT